MFKYLLEEDEFRLMLKEFNYEFEKLDAKIDSISVEKILNTMGIPKNYMEILDMWGDMVENNLFVDDNHGKIVNKKNKKNKRIKH